ncbi:hypothetical protein GJ688_11460 [Heliobacillus mobilis]|uniref:Copper amine oxidase-like N-terminal domain-containing protein n=1 Tax=Heliobacterium mobile TaxID=28064 RepID=A0A6I3SKZ7_HELMO|nr:copper amine oxidase N-terminal domain-containing protein [Heliobacterium mobile]MTV49594.1 hypothetical protein [Heliobacterium mobile]
MTRKQIPNLFRKIGLAILLTLFAAFSPSAHPAQADDGGYQVEWVYSTTSQTDLRNIREAVDEYIRNDGALRGYAGQPMVGYGGYPDSEDRHRVLYNIHFIGYSDPKKPLEVSPVELSRGTISFGKLPDGYQSTYSATFQVKKDDSQPDKWIVESVYGGKPPFYRIGFIVGGNDSSIPSYATVIVPRSGKITNIYETTARFQASIPSSCVDTVTTLRYWQLDVQKITGDRNVLPPYPLRGIHLESQKDEGRATLFVNPFKIRFAVDDIQTPSIALWDKDKKTWQPIITNVVTDGKERWAEAETAFTGDFALFSQAVSKPVEADHKANIFDSLEQIGGVNVNKTPVRFDIAKPYIEDNRVMVPLRPIAEAIGATVQWELDEEQQKVEIYKNGKQIGFYIGQKRVITNGPALEIDVPAKIVDGQTVVPVRFLAQALDLDIAWDSLNKIVNITAKD